MALVGADGHLEPPAVVGELLFVGSTDKAHDLERMGEHLMSKAQLFHNDAIVISEDIEEVFIGTKEARSGAVRSDVLFFGAHVSFEISDGPAIELGERKDEISGVGPTNQEARDGIFAHGDRGDIGVEIWRQIFQVGGQVARNEEGTKEEEGSIHWHRGKREEGRIGSIERVEPHGVNRARIRRWPEYPGGAASKR